MQKKLARLALLSSFGLVLGSGCDADDHDHDHHDETGDHDHETEVISTVELTFTPEGGGDAVVAKFEDPDGDGGVSGTSDPITLAAGTTYSLAIRFLNELEDPAEDITEEIKAEAEEHLVFVDGGGLVTHAYADMESDYGDNAVGDDLPVGVANTITTDAAGTDASFRVVLRHLPEFNGAAQKTADLPQAFADGETLPGDVDADVSFELTVE
jgi:hypothetical protein